MSNKIGSWKTKATHISVRNEIDEARVTVRRSDGGKIWILRKSDQPDIHISKAKYQITKKER